MKQSEIRSFYKLPKLKPETICICGSTRFKDLMMAVAKDMTLQGYIVVMPLVFPHSGDDITDKQKEKLDGLHLWKIMNSSLVCAVCSEMYIGHSTIKELNFAFDQGISIKVINDGQFMFWANKCLKISFSQYMQFFSEKSQQTYKEMVEKGELK